MLTDALSSDVLQGALKAAFAAVLCYGCISDIRRLQIPNAVSLAITALFFLNYFLLAHPANLTPHLAAGIAAFIAAFALYAAGVMGAGDVKLISALMLWGGVSGGMVFLVVMSLAGGLFAGLLLALRQILLLWPPAARYVPSRRLKNWAARGIFPYGIAICLAGLIMMPSFFAPQP